MGFGGDSNEIRMSTDNREKIISVELKPEKRKV